MARSLIGTTVKILSCTVVVKEVSSLTIGGDTHGRDTIGIKSDIDATEKGVTSGGDANISEATA